MTILHSVFSSTHLLRPRTGGPGGTNNKIYISLLEGTLEGPRLACLIKALYGLKQSPRCWNITVNGVYRGRPWFCAVVSHFDPSIYGSADGVFLVIYLEDLLIIGAYVPVETIKYTFAQRFEG